MLMTRIKYNTDSCDLYDTYSFFLNDLIQLLVII